MELPPSDVVFNSTASWDRAVVQAKALGQLSSWDVLCFASSSQVSECVNLFDRSQTNSNSITKLMNYVDSTGVTSVGSPAYVR